MSTELTESRSQSFHALEIGRHIERLIVDHTAFADAKAHLIRLSDRAYKLKDPGGLVLLGESGTGKDSLIEQMKLVLGAAGVIDVDRRRLIVVHTAAVPSIGDFITQMLEQVGYAFAKMGNADNHDRREILIRALLECQVQLILVNEFQQVVEGSRSKLGHSVTDWFKRLYDETHIPMAFMGTPLVRKAIEINEQFASRFSGRYWLTPLDRSSDFLGVLQAFDHAVPELKPAGLEQSNFADSIYEATNGVMRPLKHLVKEAVMLAISRGHEKLTLTHFRDGYKRVHGVNDKPTPFDRGASCRIK